MFNIGGGEFMVIALIALIVLGPQRLPNAARQIGKAMGELRRMSSGFQQELRGALHETDSGSAPGRDVVGNGARSRQPPSTPGEDPVERAVQSVSAQAGPTKPARRRRAPLRAAPEEPGRDAPSAGRRPRTP